MSSWLDPYLDSLAGKLGLNKSNAGFMADAMAQDPGAERQADRYEATARRTDPTYGPEIIRQMALEKPYVAPVVHGPESVRKMPQPTVHLPPIQMQRDVPELPTRLPTQLETAYDIQRRQQPPEEFNMHLLDQLQAAERRSGLPSDRIAYGRGDGKGMFYSPHQGRDMDENEAYAYLDFLEGR